MLLVEYFRNVAKIDLYIVGGFVRDHLLGQESKDIDFVTSEDLQTFIKRLKYVYPESVSRVITYKKYKTISMLFRIDDQFYSVDIGNFRGSLYEDTVRRDFTVNSIYIELFPENWKFHDLCGGIVDLQRRHLVPHSTTSFLEDPIRLIRGIRFAVRYDMAFSSVFWECFSKIKDGQQYMEMSNHRKYKEFIRCCNESPYHIPTIIFRIMIMLGYSNCAVFSELFEKCDSPEMIEDVLKQSLCDDVVEKLFGVK